jgi:hypothetical protein
MKKLLTLVLLVTSSLVFAQREYIDDPALHVHEPMDKLHFMHQEIKKVLGKPDVYEAYWEIKGAYVNNPTVHMRRMLFFVDCSPENFPDSKPIHVALSTIALGDDRGNMIKIYLIPPGTEEWMEWSEVSFITQEHITKICNKR